MPDLDPSPPADTLSSVLALHGRHLAGKPALIDHGGDSFTYADLDEAVGAYAAMLGRQGVSAGDVVAIAADPTATAIAAVAGILAAGAVAAPVNTRLGTTDLAEYIECLQPALFVEGVPMAARPPASIPVIELEPGGGSGGLTTRLGVAAGASSRPSLPLPGDPAIAFPTGGTTGIPKAALRTHRSLTSLVVANAVHLEVRRTDRELYLSPIFHLSLVSGLLPTLYMGGTVLLMPSFEADDAVRAFREFAPTRLLCTPTVMARIAEAAAGQTLSDAEVRVTYGAARNAPDFFDRVRAVLPHARLVTGYGATEFGAVTRLYPEEAGWGTEGAVGRPVAGVGIVIADEAGQPVPNGTVGEIVVTSPFCMERYLGRAEHPFTDEGAIRSGDLGRFDTEGCLLLTGRLKEMIKTGGENVFPAEVESALHRHRAVLDAAVFGVDDPQWGERVEAAVVVSPEVTIDDEELKRHCGSHLAGFKVPKRFHFVDELPYTSTMKVDRRRLRALSDD